MFRATRRPASTSIPESSRPASITKPTSAPDLVRLWESAASGRDVPSQRWQLAGDEVLEQDPALVRERRVERPPQQGVAHADVEQEEPGMPNRASVSRVSIKSASQFLAETGVG